MVAGPGRKGEPFILAPAPHLAPLAPCRTGHESCQPGSRAAARSQTVREVLWGHRHGNLQAGPAAAFSSVSVDFPCLDLTALWRKVYLLTFWRFRFKAGGPSLCLREGTRWHVGSFVTASGSYDEQRSREEGDTGSQDAFKGTCMPEVLPESCSPEGPPWELRL